MATRMGSKALARVREERSRVCVGLATVVIVASVVLSIGCPGNALYYFGGALLFTLVIVILWRMFQPTQAYEMPEVSLCGDGGKVDPGFAGAVAGTWYQVLSNPNDAESKRFGKVNINEGDRGVTITGRNFDEKGEDKSTWTADIYELTSDGVMLFKYILDHGNEHKKGILEGTFERDGQKQPFKMTGTYWDLGKENFGVATWHLKPPKGFPQTT